MVYSADNIVFFTTVDVYVYRLVTKILLTIIIMSYVHLGKQPSLLISEDCFVILEECFVI